MTIHDNRHDYRYRRMVDSVSQLGLIFSMVIAAIVTFVAVV